MLPRSWIDALFTKFETMYGQQFIDKWKNCNVDQVKQTWAEELGSLNGETIKAGIEVCKDTCKFPPSLPEFYQLCKSMRKPPEQRFNLPHHKKYSPEVAKENLEKIKDLLKHSKFGVHDD